MNFEFDFEFEQDIYLPINNSNENVPNELSTKECLMQWLGNGSASIGSNAAGILADGVAISLCELFSFGIGNKMMKCIMNPKLIKNDIPYTKINVYLPRNTIYPSPKTIVRLTKMMGIELTTECISKLYLEPRMFTFSLSDLNNVGPRIKHNLNLLDFSEAQLLCNSSLPKQYGVVFEFCGCVDSHNYMLRDTGPQHMYKQRQTQDNH